MMGKAQTSSLVLLGDIYMNAGMTDLARDAYVEVIEKDAGGVQFGTALRAADLLLRSRALDDAGKVLASIGERYKDLDEDDDLKVLTLKAKLARAQGRSKEAARLLTSIVERDGTRGDALLELAAYHKARGDREKALLLIEQAERLDAFEYQARLDHAQFMVAEHDYAAAADLLRRALQIKREPRVEQFLARVEDAIDQ
jgi:Flp pilus assembly protein TadD